MQAAVIVAPVQGQLAALEELISAVANVDQAPMASLLQHVLGTKGKRLRPAMAFLIAQLCGHPPDRLVPLAAAIELLHTATLVHDDMIDNATTRRGMATLHALAGGKVSVLVGDYLFARAADFAAQAENIRVMSAFARVLMDICNGELRQLFGRHSNGNDSELISRQEYYRRIEHKTASLFRATTEMSGVLSGASEERVQALRDYGLHLGMAFQMADDILDLVGDEREIGKPAGHDLRQGTITLPVIYFAELYPNNPAIRQLELGSAGEDEVCSIIELVRTTGCIRRAREEAVQHVEQAVKALSDFPRSAARDSLEQLAGFSLSRTV